MHGVDVEDDEVGICYEGNTIKECALGLLKRPETSQVDKNGKKVTQFHIPAPLPKLNDKKVDDDDVVEEPHHVTFLLSIFFAYFI